MLLLKIYFAGLAVLLVAVLLNVLAGVWGLATWYSFLNQAAGRGLAAAARELTVVEIMFLVVLYPFLLGLAAWAVLALTGAGIGPR